MKRFSTIIAAAAAASLVAAPAMAATAGAIQPVSVAKSARASAPVGKGEKLGGGVGLFGALIAAGVAAIVIIAAVDNDDSDSN